jgi:hypothetical protein
LFFVFKKDLAIGGNQTTPKAVWGGLSHAQASAPNWGGSATFNVVVFFKKFFFNFLIFYIYFLIFLNIN